MSSLLNRIAVFSARHRALVIGVWLVLLVGLGFAAKAAGTKYSSSAEVTGSDQRRRERGDGRVVLQRAARREPDRLPHR